MYEFWHLSPLMMYLLLRTIHRVPVGVLLFCWTNPLSSAFTRTGSPTQFTLNVEFRSFSSIAGPWHSAQELMLAVGTVAMLTCGTVQHLLDSLQGIRPPPLGWIAHNHMVPCCCDPTCLFSFWSGADAGSKLWAYQTGLRFLLDIKKTSSVTEYTELFSLRMGSVWYFLIPRGGLPLTHCCPSDRPPSELLMASSSPVWISKLPECAHCVLQGTFIWWI